MSEDCCTALDLFRFKNARTRWDFDFQGGDVSRRIPDASVVAQVVDCLKFP
jgi:hypothetical protein